MSRLIDGLVCIRTRPTSLPFDRESVNSAQILHFAGKEARQNDRYRARAGARPTARSTSAALRQS